MITGGRISENHRIIIHVIFLIILFKHRKWIFWASIAFSASSFCSFSLSYCFRLASFSCFFSFSFSSFFFFYSSFLIIFMVAGLRAVHGSEVEVLISWVFSFWVACVCADGMSFVSMWCCHLFVYFYLLFGWIYCKCLVSQHLHMS